MNEACQTVLDAYLATLSQADDGRERSFSAGYFCADEVNANLCADLIVKGEKRASCSMEYWYTHQNESYPKVGNLHVVTNWLEEPLCIIELTEVTRCQYKDITAEFAAAEGEGDKSLSWWRDAHWDFFSNECEELGIAPTEEMWLVLERFQVVHQVVKTNQ